MHFREQQKFGAWWLIAIILLMVVGAWYAFIQQVILGEPVGSNPLPDALVIVLVIFTGVILPGLFLSMRMITEVRNDGLYIRFVPFLFKFRKIDLESAATIERVTYRPLMDYGGWGIRMTRKGKAYNVKGNEGIRIEYENGRHLLIGSQKADELLVALHEVDSAMPVNSSGEEE